MPKAQRQMIIIAKFKIRKWLTVNYGTNYVANIYNFCKAFVIIQE